MLAWYKDWPNLIKNILWSDEAVFHIGRFVNHHSCDYWTEEDRCIISENFQHLPKIMLWYGMRLVGLLVLLSFSIPQMLKGISPCYKIKSG